MWTSGQITLADGYRVGHDARSFVESDEGNDAISLSY